MGTTITPYIDWLGTDHRKESSDYETRKNHSIRVRVTDVGGLSYESSLKIAIQDGPDAPTAFYRQQHGR